MPYSWRDLSKIDIRLKKISSCVPLFHAELGYQGSNKPAYFIGVYKCMLANAHEVWYMEKQWSFVKNGETIEGHSIGYHHSNITGVFEALKESYITQIGKKWVLLHLVPIFTDEIESVTELFGMFSNFVDVTTQQELQQEANILTEKVEFTPQYKANKNKQTSFKELQKKRQTKAEW